MKTGILVGGCALYNLLGATITGKLDSQKKGSGSRLKTDGFFICDFLKGTKKKSLVKANVEITNLEVPDARKPSFFNGGYEHSRLPTQFLCESQSWLRYSHDFPTKKSLPSRLVEAFLEETCGTVANAFDIMAGR